MEISLGSFVAFETTQPPMGDIYKIPARKRAVAGFLTPREIEILEILGIGLSVKGAARELDISPGTVKWHVKNIYYKLGASSREDALSKARLRKII
ncbi:MAG: helix-turn-helix transcriptional regulator [Pseudomonadota bacterium]